MSRAEMAALGWDSCDVILITGDAYIDHPSFGMALVGRLLEAQGFRVGILSQPDWRSVADFQRLGKPNLYFGVTAGNMDSMVNRYTSERKIRSDDAYTPNGDPHRRPDRALTIYAQQAKAAYPGVPVVLGSIEASLRRVAHYDYWSDTVRRSVLPDSKADLLIYGNAERALVELTHRMARGEPIRDIRDLKGTAFMTPRGWKPGEDWGEVDASTLDAPSPVKGRAGEGFAALGVETAVVPSGTAQNPPQSPLVRGEAGRARFARGAEFNAEFNLYPNPYAMPAQSSCDSAPADSATVCPLVFTPAQKILRHHAAREKTVLRLPAYEAVKDNPTLYAHASRTLHLESNPGNARALVQAHGERDVWLNPPPLPLTTAEMDGVYDLPYARAPHPAYDGSKIPAWEMIRFSISIMRGCFGGCTFCSITEHEGRIIQSRSETSILREIETIRDRTPGFTGVISDLGGPTANMYRLACKDKAIEAACRRLSCVYPGICERLDTNHDPLIALYKKARALRGVKKVLIGSGLRYDLAIRSPEYVRELVTHHVGGYLKIAPEHTEAGPLSKMMKPGMGSYEAFKRLFEKFSQAAGKEQYLIPYFIAAHPGTSDTDMLNLALWLKANQFRLDQVQTFLPTPMALATTMWHSRKNPLKRVSETAETVEIARAAGQRKLHKAFLRYHDPANWPLLREALKRLGRADLIGNGKKHLIPNFQPTGTGEKWGDKRVFGVGKAAGTSDRTRMETGEKTKNQTKNPRRRPR
ncbi:MAG: YgiQ family radical SAM protein [Zoogloeaceae bacterium]|nr:YgiQ family radical SAM protein [Zoogloeaceae bacterium]